MGFPAGTRFGVYEVVAPLGAGGMGEIYRARDERLRRDVAIKVLPERSSRDAAAISRLQKEARAASALNHPHILTIYDIGRSDTEPPRDYIVMEFIEGETLRDWLAKERDFDSVLDRLIQIADGLAKAHEALIVHRDLKPDNVMVTSDGYAKILDFGLATVQPAFDSIDTTLRADSMRGVISGTVGYMAPEQAQGLPSDARADVFSFGCIAYEAVARRRAFLGANAYETLHQTITATPAPLRSVVADAPAELERIINRCLAKDPADRYGSMRGVAWELRRFRDARSERPAPRLPRLTQLTFDKAVEQFPAIDAAGERVVFSREVGKVRNLFMTAIDGGGEQRLAASDFDQTQAAWSPAGEVLLFVRGRQAGVRLELSDVFGRYIGGDIFALDIGSGRETLLISDAANPSWSADGERIAFDSSLSGPHRIWIADRRGRNAQQITTDVSDAVHHVRPRWSPDGSHLVFQTLEGTKLDIRAASVETRQMRAVTNDYTMDLHPVWSPDGASIYFSSYRSGGINIWRLPVLADGSPAGPMEQVTAGPGHDVDLDIAKNGRLVFAILRQNADIWRLPVDPSTGDPAGPPEAVIASTRENSRAVWSPDGASIAFSSDRTGEMNLWLIPSSGGRARQLTRGAGGDFQPNWSPDGRTLVFFSGRSGTLDIWRVDVDGGDPMQLTRNQGLNINPFFSPDGKRVAFQSDRDGGLEVWVMNADGSDPMQLTTVGVSGHFLRWSADGERIYFRCPAAPEPRTMIVPSQGGEPQTVAKVAGGAHMSLSPDQSMIMDVVGHRTLWVSPLHAGAPRRVFEFDDPDSRIDYPVWSPDGRWITFDRFVPRGGDVWMVDVEGV